MLRKNIIQFVILSALICSVVCSTCSSPTAACYCFIDDDGQKVINCRYKGLHQIPSFTPTGEVYDRIIFTSTEPTGLCTYPDCNNITQVKANAFANLKVKSVDLRNNPITSFDKDAFQGIESFLTGLSIEGDGVEPPPYASIAILRHLQSLHLENFRQVDITHANTDLIFPQLHTLTLSRISGVSVIEPSTFANIPMLTSLNLLKLPSLYLLPVSAILKLSKLQFLSIFETKLTAIYGDSFHKLSNLQSVNLDGNKDLVSIERHAFRGIEDTLESLFLSRTGLDANALMIFKELNWTSLTHLNLGNNDLGFIPSGLFQTMNRLSFLNLQNTRLSFVNKTMFTGLTNLKTLDIGYNNIGHIAVAAFKNSPGLNFLILDEQTTKTDIDVDFRSFYGISQVLEHLLIKNNKILASAFWEIIRSLPNLVHIDAEKLGLTNIPDKTLMNNLKLSSIDLSGNNITAISQSSFFGPRESLSVIDLQNNNIQTLSKCVLNAFARQPQIIISGNPLVCDCKISWLYDWVMRQPEPIVASISSGSTCESPAALRGKIFFEFNRSDLSCPSNYVQPTCEDMYSSSSVSSSTSTTTEVLSTTMKPAVPLYELVITQVTKTTIALAWTVHDKTNITGYLLEFVNKANGNIKTIHIHRNVTTYKLFELTPESVYYLCLKVTLNGVVENSHTECLTSMTTSDTGSANILQPGVVVG